MHIVTQNLFWLCTTVLVGGNVICNLFWSHTLLPTTFLAMHTIRHNFFWLLITIHAQTFLITYIVTHHILACAHCYTQLFWVRHNVIHNFLVTYITTHNFFYYAYISLHTSFLLLCTTLCTTLSLATHTITHNFYWLCTLSHTIFLSCTTSCITLCWLPTLAEFTL